MHEVVIVICTVDEKLAPYGASLLQNKVASIISEKNINQAEGAITIPITPRKPNESLLDVRLMEIVFILGSIHECALPKLSDSLCLTCANLIGDTLASSLRKPPKKINKKDKKQAHFRERWAFLF